MQAVVQNGQQPVFNRDLYNWISNLLVVKGDG